MLHLFNVCLIVIILISLWDSDQINLEQSQRVCHTMCRWHNIPRSCLIISNCPRSHPSVHVPPSHPNPSLIITQDSWDSRGTLHCLTSNPRLSHPCTVCRSGNLADGFTWLSRTTTQPFKVHQLSFSGRILYIEIELFWLWVFWYS